jgi:hypothetical protein
MATIVEKLAEYAWIDVQPLMQFGYTFQRNDDPNRSVSGMIKGLYFFAWHNTKPSVSNCIYVGETFTSNKYQGIQNRIRNHKQSLRDPSWKVELTGKKFIASKLDLDMKIDMWYVDADLLGVNDKQSSKSIEQLVQKHIKPTVWSDIK